MIALSSLIGPRTILPLLAVPLCYPLRNWARPEWKMDATRRLALAAYTALAVYVAVILSVNFSQLFLWHHVTENLYPALGGAWGIEHVIGFALAFVVYRRAAAPPEIFQDTTIFLRGRRLISYVEAFAIAAKKMRGEERHVWWGMVPLRVEEAVKNFLVVGAPGSGKTVTIQLLLQSIVPFMRIGSRVRMLLYDAKSELWPILAAMNPACVIRTFNLSDRRCDAWHMAKDIRTRKDTREAAAILVPENPNKRENAFFLETTRLVLQGVMEALILSKKDTWTLRDLVLALKTPKRFEAVLSAHEETRHILTNLANKETRDNVLSTVQNVRERLTPMAAVWHEIWPDESRRLSLTDWVNSDSILLLGEATAEGSPVRVLNQLVIQRVSELLDRKPNSGSDRTWLIFDELTDLQYVRGLDLVLRKGRSKGVATVLGFQTWPGMVKAFQHDFASEITALCAYKSFLGVNDPSTAHWAAAHFGQHELLEYRVSQSESVGDGRRTVGRSRNSQQVTRPSVMPEEFLTIPATNAENGFTGYHLSPQVEDGYKSEIPWSWVMERLGDTSKKPPIRALPASVEEWGTDENDFQYLPDWSDEECKTLGIPPVTDLDSQSSSSSDKSVAEKVKNIKRTDLNS